MTPRPVPRAASRRSRPAMVTSAAVRAGVSFGKSKTSMSVRQNSTKALRASASRAAASSGTPGMKRAASAMPASLALGTRPSSRPSPPARAWAAPSGKAQTRRLNGCQ